MDPQQQPPQGYYQQPYYPQPPQQPPKKKSMGCVQWGAIVLVALIVIGGIGAALSGGKTSNSTAASVVNAGSNPTVQPAVTTAAAPAGVGATLKGSGYVVTLNSVDKQKSFNSMFGAKTGNILVALDVTVQSEKDSGVSVNPFYCHLKDSDGFNYSLSIAGKDPSLSSQNNLPSGNKMRGWVTFEVPETAKGLVFEYQAIGSPRFQFTLG